LSNVMVGRRGEGGNRGMAAGATATVSRGAPCVA